MKRFLILSLSAIALAVAFTPEVEAGFRGGRCGRGGFRARPAERRSERGGRFLFQGRGQRGGCQSCDASDAGDQQAPELIRFPAELLPEVRFAEAAPSQE